MGCMSLTSARTRLSTTGQRSSSGAALPGHVLRRSSKRDIALTSTILNPVELRRQGFAALVNALGWVNAVRFLQQYDTGEGNYTRERASILPDWDVETVVKRALRKDPLGSERASERRIAIPPLGRGVGRHVAPRGCDQPRS